MESRNNFVNELSRSIKQEQHNEIIYLPDVKAVPGNNTQRLFDQLPPPEEVKLTALPLRKDIAKWDHDHSFPYPESIPASSFKEEKIENVSVDIYRAPSEDDLTPTVLFLHGGAFFCEMSNVHRSLMANIAAKIPCNGILPHYLLAPESKAPQVIQGVTRVLRAILLEPKKYGVTNNLVVIGYSSGGNLAWNAVMNILNSPDTKALADTISNLFLMSPWVDISMATTKNSPYQQQQERDKMLQIWALEQMATWYLPANASSADPLFSPIYRSPSDMKGMPKTTVIAGEVERLLGDAVQTVNVLRNAGVFAELIILEGQSHNHSAHAGLRDGVFTPDIIVARMRDQSVAHLKGNDGLGVLCYGEFMQHDHRKAITRAKL